MYKSSTHFPSEAGDAGSEGNNPLGWEMNTADLTLQVSESNWRAKKETVPQACQTEDLKSIDQGVQAAPVGNEKLVQTDAVKSEILNPGDPYPPSLFAFFAKVTDSVCDILSENEDPFLNDLFSDYNEDNENENTLEVDVTKAFELRNEKIPEGVAASCVAWNKTGGQVAVGHTFPEHEGWCTHLMPICIWNLNRTEAVNPKVPHIEIEFGSCISSLEFHPVENNLLGVGLHSGEIALVDLSMSSYFTGVSKAQTEQHGDDPTKVKKQNECILDLHSEGHNRKIVSLKWARLSQGNISELFKTHPSGSSVALVTASMDGYIALWSVAKTGSKIFLEKLFLVSSENLSEDINVGNRFKVGMKEIGVTSLGSCRDDPVTLVFSTHGSFVFQGSLLNDIEISEAAVNRSEADSERNPLVDPVTSMVAQDIGLISNVDCSPYYRNLFLYLTAEGLCILQNLSQPTIPSLTVAQDVGAVCTDVKWSTRPLIFALTNKNMLLFYDLKEFEESSQPILELDHEEQLQSIAFNRNRPELVGVTDMLGTLHIWKLPAGLITTSNLDGEVDILIQMGQVEAKK